MAATSQAENVLGLSNKDLSLIRHSLEAGGKLIHQVINGLKHGTSEVQQLILQQSDVILECRVCRNLFRSLPNYLDHKRIYCQELFPNESLSLLASPFADEVPIIYPEPPDDAKEFVEMSDLINKANQKLLKSSPVDSSSPNKGNKSYIQNSKESIGATLEQSCRRGKPQPVYLRPIKETNVAMQLVPLTTNNASENQNQMVLANSEGIDLNESERKSCNTEHRNLNHTLIKLANFHKLLCLKCNQTYTSKKKLIYHIKKFHIKKYRKCRQNRTSEKCKTNTQVENQSSSKNVGHAKARSSKMPKRKKDFDNKSDLEGFSTKSGKPSLKKFSYLAKKSNVVNYANIKNGWCHICNHSYSGKRGLVFHMFRMHSGCRKIYTCPFCEVKFPSFASALRHTQTLHNCKKSDMKHVVKKLKASGHFENQELKSMLEPEIKVEKCDSKMNVLFQDSSIESNGSLSDPAEEDTNSNTSQQKSKFKCQKCLQIFSGIRGLRHHITRKHSQKTAEHSYTCHICFMAFFTNFSLKRHYRLKHNIQENSQEKPNAERKVEAVHKQVKTEHIPCQATSPSMLDRNILLHNNKKYRIPLKYYKTVSKLAHFPSLCLNCKQTFAGARDLISHIIRAHCTYKNAFPCPFCHLSFISSVSILRHTKVQHSCSDQEIAELSRKLQVWEQQKKGLDLRIKKPVNNISDSTDEVQNDATTSDILTCQDSHSIHDVTDFQTPMCLQCNRKFSGVPGLLTHINRVHHHLSEQKHKCSQCTESFESVYAIIKHMENFHKVFFKQKQTHEKSNRLLEIDESAGPSSLDEECTEEIEKKFDSCKSDGEDAPNSKLVMQCADFLRSRCLRCKDIFAGNRGLIAHIYKAHAHHGQTYSCYICLKTFASYALASQHTRNSHIYKGSAMMYVRVNNISGEV